MHMSNTKYVCYIVPPDQIFMCEFGDEARSKVFSARVRGISHSSNTWNIWCPIPEHIQ